MLGKSQKNGYNNNVNYLLSREKGAIIMLTAVKGYYNGSQIVMDEDIKLTAGQEVIVTILEMQRQTKKNIDLKKYMGRGEKMFPSDAQEYIKELRDSDRI